MIKDYLHLALRSITARKIRSWLTMIGIIVGITAVVSLISLGQGLQDSVNNQFKSLGSNRLIIAPGGSFLGPGTADLVATIIDDDDLDIIRRVRGVQTAQGVLVKSLRAEFDDFSETVTVFAFDTSSDARSFVESVGLFDIGEGRELKSGDKFKVVMGNHIAKASDHFEIGLGRKLIIEDKDFDVVGIQKLIGTGVHDLIVRMPQNTLRELTDEPEKFSLIFALTDDGQDPTSIAEDIKKELRRHRDVKEGEEDFNVQTADQAIEQFNAILLAVQIVIIGIAAISLLVGGIGITNAMYTAVLERTKEIGVMKSIGARNNHILWLFLLESGMVGLAGGLAGLILGVSIALVGEYLVATTGTIIFRAYLGLPLIIGTLAFSFFVGTISGILPARQASKLAPVDALRSVK